MNWITYEPWSNPQQINENLKLGYSCVQGSCLFLGLLLISTLKALVKRLNWILSGHSSVWHQEEPSTKTGICFLVFSFWLKRN